MDGLLTNQRDNGAVRKLPGCSFVKFWNKIHEDCQSQSPETKTFMGNNAVVCDHAAKCVSGNPRNPRTPPVLHTSDQLDDILMQIKYLREDMVSSKCCGGGDGASTSPPQKEEK